VAATRSTKSATSASIAKSAERGARAGRTTRVPAAPRAPRAGGTGSAADFIPPRPTLPKLRAASKGCRGCNLWRVGTQTVFGEGPPAADVMFVGEQPGDKEDLAGRPFVGPSGRLLDAALEAAGIARDRVYVTNAVKHFKWTRGEKSARRIHKTPNSGEITACHPWLEAEIALVKPRVIVCLGATSARALLGKAFRVSTQRGKVQRSETVGSVIATVHPSSVLRVPDAEAREKAEKEFFADVRKVGRELKRSGKPGPGTGDRGR